MPMNATGWFPDAETIATANITQWMTALGLPTVSAFHTWSTQHYAEFWSEVCKRLGIRFDQPYESVCNLSAGIESPQWFPGAKLNIANSCFMAPPDAVALCYQDKDHRLCQMTYGELDQLSNQVANSLLAAGFEAGDALSVIMPMNPTAIALYLGIIKMGGMVVCIADSFSSDEMATRLTIGNVKAVFTQQYIPWGTKTLPLYEKVLAASPPKMIVRETDEHFHLRSQDMRWEDFLSNNKKFTSVSCDPMSACTLLFSSGTTGIPKAIPWNHTTPIKAGSDAHFHQNIKPGDRLCWPTSLGWMMGPWLIFAALLNRASIALYTGAPKDRAFGEFIQEAQVTMLGVVPTLVAVWRESRCMETLNWSAINVFSSTGECSNAEDMHYLMSLVGGKPVIEYCGGTEIGGAYITSTVVQENIPAQFSTPAMGMHITMIDEQGHPAETGEVCIIPPSIGLSTTLFNTDHHKIYFAGMPTIEGVPLRRHGDQIRRHANGYFSILGRVDDTMNLGGIKISAVEIERCLCHLPQVLEVAAIAVSPPGNGPSQLIIYATTTVSPDIKTLMKDMQAAINKQLNPLFKIHEVVFVGELPKTASNKIMRRLLRDQYLAARDKKNSPSGP